MGKLLPLCASSEGAADDLHLVLCPFAGGSTNAFRSWRHLQPVGMKVSLFVYPGRDHRMHEPCAGSIGELADQVVAQIATRDIDSQRLIVAGHSMGAQVAYEVCARLERRGLAPRGLVLSGCHAPHLRGRRRISHLEDRAFLEELAAIGGNASGLLNEPSMWSTFLPMLRSDFLATEGYWHPRKPPPDQRLQTPALLVCGYEDEEVHHSEVDAWKSWLCHAQGPAAMAGDHFHIVQDPMPFLNCTYQFGATACLR
jgi:thioesterase component of yersiniabactin synthetase